MSEIDTERHLVVILGIKLKFLFLYFIVHFPPEQISSSSPNRDGQSGKKSNAGLPTNETSQDQPSAPPSPAKSVQAQASTTVTSADQEVRKSRFTILPIAASASENQNSEGQLQQQPQQAPPAQNYQPTGTQGTTPVTRMTPESTIHQGGQSQQPVAQT